MPARKFSSTALSPGNWTVLVVGTSGKDATLSINVVNFNTFEIRVSFALTDNHPSSGFPVSDIFIYNQIVHPEDSRQFRGVVLPENKYLIAFTSANNVTSLVFGFED